MTRQITRPGIYQDFDVAAYFADPCPQPSLSQSIAKLLIDRSPAHAHLAHRRLGKPIDEEEDYKPATAIGNAAHALATGRSRDLAIGEWADWRTKEAKTFKASAHDSGHLPILRKHLTSAEEVVRAMGRQLAAAGHAQAFAKSDQCEVVLAWEEDGIWLRTMIDCVVGLGIYDLKTGGLNCAPHLMAERPSTEGWDIQAAMFARGLDRLDPENAGRRRFFFVGQENKEPYALTVVQTGEADLTLGAKKLEHAIGIWRQCITSGQWPAYPAETVMSHPRGWTETQWLEREMDHAARRHKPAADQLMGG